MAGKYAESLRYTSKDGARSLSQIDIREVPPDVYEGFYSLLDLARTENILPDPSIQGANLRWEDVTYFKRDERSEGNTWSTIKICLDTEHQPWSASTTRIDLDVSGCDNFDSWPLVDLSVSKYFHFVDGDDRPAEICSVATSLELGKMPDSNILYIKGARLCLGFGHRNHSFSFDFGSDMEPARGVGDRLSTAYCHSMYENPRLSLGYKDGKLTSVGEKLFAQYGIGGSFPFRFRFSGFKSLMRTLSVPGQLEGNSIKEVLSQVKRVSFSDLEAEKMAILDKESPSGL